MPVRFSPGQSLLIDADDTLWENNIYFERAIAAFIKFLDHESFTVDEIRHRLDSHEHESIRTLGYGLPSFTRSLVACFEQLRMESITQEAHGNILRFVQSIREHEITLLPGVAEQLPKLAARHQLILMTKGVPVEQTDKLIRSGLQRYFTAVEVVAEKDPAAYRAVVAQHNLDRTQTWMIGNSPRSDVNPALAAGLHAVLLFNKDTWTMEHASVDNPPPGQHCIELNGFHKLGDYF